MALFFYRKNLLEKSYNDLGSQIMMFFEDIKKVYPGYVDGKESEGLFLKNFDCPTVESEDIGYLLPPKRARNMTVDEFIEIATDSDEEKTE